MIFQKNLVDFIFFTIKPCSTKSLGISTFLKLFLIFKYTSLSKEDSKFRSNKIFIASIDKSILSLFFKNIFLSNNSIDFGISLCSSLLYSSNLISKIELCLKK